MKYVDGFVLVVPKKNLKAYQKMARLGAKVWMDLGAVAYQECVGEDMAVHCGLPFPELTKAKPNEVVVFSWIAYKSRAHRDRVNKLVMADQRLAKMASMKMPFDPARMAYGGFKTIVRG